MARSGSVRRICCGWLLLFCVLSTVEASTRQPVVMPSAAVAAEKATSYAIVDGALEAYISPMSGDYIPASPKNVPVRGIIGGTSFGLNTIKSGAKSLLKGGVQALLVGAAIDQLLKGVDWLMVDGTLTKKNNTPAPPVNTDQTAGQYSWTSNPLNGWSSSAKGACERLGELDHGYSSVSVEFLDEDSANCTIYGTPFGTQKGYVGRSGSSCPSNSSYSSSAGGCVSNAAIAPLPVTYADIDSSIIDDWVNAQNSEFVKNLLKDVCHGSINPNACYDSMKKQALALKGPSTVTADATTTTTTVANPNGTTSTVVTNNNTKYNIVYGSDSFTFDKNTNTTVTTDGKPTSATTTTTDPVDPADPTTPEEPAPTPDEPTAAPCVGTNCTGPAYTKLYEPTKDTKEKFIDSFSDRITQAPIISAASGFFHVTAGSGCPVWSAHPIFSVYQASFDAELVFDFHCQPWFVSMAQYAKIVMSIVCAYLAFRQAFLD